LNNLKEIRSSKGLSQFELAKLSNITPADISKIENNWICPFPGWRKRLASALKVRESDLFPSVTAGGASNGK
jgi:ribosome-binding protein aMBF1 (putative translation factor)